MSINVIDIKMHTVTCVQLMFSITILDTVLSITDRRPLRYDTRTIYLRCHCGHLAI